MMDFEDDGIGSTDTIIKNLGASKSLYSVEKKSVDMGPQHTTDNITIGRKRYRLILEDDNYRSQRVVAKKRDGAMLIPMENCTKILISARSGSGKTVVIRSIFNRAYLHGKFPIILTDVKNEYHTSTKPVQEKFRRHLGGELPQGFKMKVYRPAFLKDVSYDPRQYLMQINLTGDVSTKELQTCLEIPNAKHAQLQTLDQCLDLEKKSKNPSFRGLISRIEGSELLNSAKIQLIANIERLMDKGVIGDTYPSVDFAGDIKNGLIPVINLEGYSNSGVDAVYSHFLVGYLSKIILRLKEEGKITKHLLVVIDEILDFCPEKKNPICKDIIEQSMRKARSLKISYLMAGQSLEGLSSQIVSQADHFILPRYTHTDPYDIGVVFKRAFPNVSAQKRSAISPRYIRKKFARIWKDGSYGWMIFSMGVTPTGDLMVHTFSLYAPLSWHKEEGEL